MRIIIANAGRNASRRDVFPGDFEEAQDGSGTWAVLSVPYGVIEEREGTLQRPDVMLGYQLAMATHVLSGSWNPWESELKLVGSLKHLTSFELASASLTEWAALGNEVALRDYLKTSGENPEGPLPHVRLAAVKAADFADRLSEAIAAGTLDAEEWGSVLASVQELDMVRAQAASITWRSLAKERDLPVPKSPVAGGAQNHLWAQYELLADPLEITNTMARNPRQTAGESAFYNLLTPEIPSILGKKKYLWEGMGWGSKVIGFINNAGEVSRSALEREGANEAERRILSTAGHAVDLAAGVFVKEPAKYLKKLHSSALYAGSRIEGRRNLETMRRNVERGLAHPLVAVEGAGGFVRQFVPHAAEELLKAGVEAAATGFADKIPAGEQVKELASKGAYEAAKAGTNIESLRAVAQARKSRKPMNLMDRVEKKLSRARRFRDQHRGVSGPSIEAFYRGGSLGTWDSGGSHSAKHVISSWPTLEHLPALGNQREEPEAEAIKKETLDIPVGKDDPFINAHMLNWIRCVSDASSGSVSEQDAAKIVMESIVAVGGSISMAGTGREGTLLSYQPDFGDGCGRAALAVGDMATAEYVAVLVPGMGNSLKDLPELARHARNLHTECLRTRPGARVAIVAWMGYKAPKDIRQGHLEVMGEMPAQEGAKILKEDLRIWRHYWQEKENPARRRANLPAQPILTISGASYGSVVAGHAAVAGAAPENLVFLGSPGTGLRAQHLNVPPSNIFVAATGKDIVSVLDWFSIDPTHKNYGNVTRMKADYHWREEIGIAENLEKAHTSYYAPGTESLTNISRVVVGRAEEITQEEQRTRKAFGGYRMLLRRPFAKRRLKKPKTRSRIRRQAEATGKNKGTSPVANFDLMKEIINQRQYKMEARVPASVRKQTIDFVRSRLSAMQGSDNAERTHLGILRKDYSGYAFMSATILGEWYGIFREDSPSGPPGSPQETPTVHQSGEIYLLDVTPTGLGLQDRLGSGKVFTLNKTSSAFLSLPQGGEFRWTAKGAEVKCPPPLSTTGERLPILALVGLGRYKGLIGIISMDNEWHPVSLDVQQTRRGFSYIAVGAIVTNRFEKRALPHGLDQGEVLEPYPQNIRYEENDQLKKTEDWFDELVQEGYSEVDASFDWRGLARSTDPLLGVAQDLKIGEGLHDLSRVTLKGMLETPSKGNPLIDQAKKTIASGDEYISRINQTRIFHRHVYPDKYTSKPFPSEMEVLADLKEMKPDFWTVSYRKQWTKATDALYAAQKKFHKEVGELQLQVNSSKGHVRTDRIKIPAVPTKALNAAFTILMATNLGVSIFAGGKVEGDSLAKMVAAGSSIAVSMPLIANSMSRLGYEAGATMIGRATPFVSLFANLLSFANNITQENIDIWALTFDVLGLTADVIAILALKYAAFTAWAGPAGLALAAPAVIYMLAHWGTKIPPPDKFVKDMGEKLAVAFNTLHEDFRVDFHQRYKSLQHPYERIAGVWNTSLESQVSKQMLEQLEKEVTSSPLISKGEWLSLANEAKTVLQIQAAIKVRKNKIHSMGLKDSLVNEFVDMLTTSPSEKLYHSLRFTDEEILQFYTELMKYCIRKISNTPPELRKDLNRESFSLWDWTSTKEAGSWIDRFGTGVTGY
ncbi:alpha/beta hydrolase [Streptomyces luteireticuli]|uniref:alpha/beta hydrolase n=1 Tax=Streptomyces luteireticuli TaxID=173858 RepID=UPI0035582C06